MSIELILVQDAYLGGFGGVVLIFFHNRGNEIILNIYSSSSCFLSSGGT